MVAYRILSYYLVYHGMTWFEKEPLRKLERLPSVTVQIPIYNEHYVATRCIQAVCAQEYPKSLLQVQVLDDSTDDTQQLCQEEVANERRLGFDIEYIHRPVRNGFKAGALREAFATAKGEFVAIFDADFVPQPGFLVSLLPQFTSDKVGMVQARWTHLNEEYSILTRAEASSLDYHFLIEQAGRDSASLFLNFNGTAGIWRKECIVDAGGWQDALAEDLDLSIRAQLNGWKLRLIPYLGCPSELPVDMAGARRQQFRWAKGGAECGRRYLRAILRERVSPFVKVNAFSQLTQHSLNVLVLAQLLLLPILMEFRFDLAPTLWNLVQIPIGPLFYYAALQKMYGKHVHRKISGHLLALLFHSGILVNNARAFMEAMLGLPSDFLRTPKFGITNSKDEWRNKRYRLRGSAMVVLEILFAMYGIASMLVATLTRNFLLLPYISVVTIGLLYVSSLSVYHSLGIRDKRS